MYDFTFQNTMLTWGSWLMFMIILLIIIVIVFFINVCINYPGLSEWTCGNRCLHWNTEFEDEDEEIESGNKIKNVIEVEDDEEGDIEDEKDSYYDESNSDTSDTCDIQYKDEQCNNNAKLCPSLPSQPSLSEIIIKDTGQ